MKTLELRLLGLGLCALTACEGKNNSDKSFGPTSSSFSYDFTYNGCATGEHSFKFYFLEEMCRALQNHALNNNCALEMRSSFFKSKNCSGEFETRVANPNPGDSNDTSNDHSTDRSDLNAVFAQYPWDLEQSEEYKRLKAKGINFDFNSLGLNSYYQWLEFNDWTTEKIKNRVSEKVKNLMTLILASKVAAPSKVSLHGHSTQIFWDSQNDSLQVPKTLARTESLNRYLVELEFYKIESAKLKLPLTLPERLGETNGPQLEATYQPEILRPIVDKFHKQYSLELSNLFTRYPLIKLIEVADYNQFVPPFVIENKTLRFNLGSFHESHMIWMQGSLADLKNLPESLRERLQMSVPMDVVQGTHMDYRYDLVSIWLNRIIENQELLLKSKKVKRIVALQCSRTRPEASNPEATCGGLNEGTLQLPISQKNPFGLRELSDVSQDVFMKALLEANDL